MKPLILITNDDGYESKGIRTLAGVAQEFGDVIVMAPERNSSAKSLSLTTDRPLRVKDVSSQWAVAIGQWPVGSGQWAVSGYGDGSRPTDHRTSDTDHSQQNIKVYACDGLPVDCLKLAYEHFCPRIPDLVLSGINHGSNSSINVLYSGTIGAVLEATMLGVQAVGFSLLNHSPEADLSACIPFVRYIVGRVLEKGLPDNVGLNVNIPRLPLEEIKGIRVCRQARARWMDSFEPRVDPRGRPYWWLTGKFECPEPPQESDEQALAEGYVSVVPIRPDLTCREAINPISQLLTTDHHE